MPKIKEIWKDIEGYEGYYQVSNHDRIKSIKRLIPITGTSNTRKYKERIRKTTISKAGYRRVTLFNKGKFQTFPTHRLIAKAFIPNPENKPCINHKNGIKDDNRIDNIEWCTLSENMQHALRTGLLVRGVGEEANNVKLKNTQVLKIRKMIGTCIEIGNKFGICPMQVSRIKRKLRWAHL